MQSATDPEASKRFRVAHVYTDKGNPHLADDEFSGWLLANDRTIGMTGGIRPRSYLHAFGVNVPAYVVLVTAHVSGTFANPWNDVIDDRSGVIQYWGDAKYSARGKSCDDFSGNKCMKAIFDELLVGDRRILPPILHFSRISTGRVVFNALCALESMELTWFEDSGRPIRNYRYGLAILDEEYLSVEWLRERSCAKSTATLLRNAPNAWTDFVRGRTRRRQIWTAHIRKTEEQLPIPGSTDEKVLHQLRGLSPEQFEAAIVALFREMKTVEHSITATRFSGDGGFDFYGSFTMPPPLAYEVALRGEAKRWAKCVGVGEVSRLVARLRRGEYGVFVTTSYYTRQAQKEVFEDAYPVKLFAGVDLVRFLRELNLVSAGEVREEWLKATLDSV
jgi:hypothetical protein